MIAVMFRDSPQIKTEHACRTAYTDPSFNFIERLIFVAVLGKKKRNVTVLPSQLATGSDRQVVCLPRSESVGSMLMSE